jgi:O-antigen ligase
MLLSALCAEHTARALVMTAATAWVFAGVFVARNLAHCLPAVRLVLAGVLAGASLGALMVYWGAASGWMTFPVYWSARIFGGHQFAGCVAALALLALPATQRRWRLLLILTAVVVWTGLAWSGSRAAAVGMAATLGLWFWRGSHPDRRVLLRWVPVLALLGLLLSFPLGAPYAQLGWRDAFSRTVQATSVEAVSSERSKFWAVVWQHVGQSPWTGHGADAYRFIHPKQNGSQPHNLILQWLLEYGVLGTIPLGLLLLRGLRSLLPIRAPSTPAVRPSPVWAAAALAGATAYGLFEGVFYHMAIFMPVAMFAGFALGLSAQVTAARARVPWIQASFRALLLVGLLVLILHNWLAWMLLRGTHVQPDSAPARLLRAFPSVTHGLQNWTEAWRRTQPDVAREWIRWAQTVSTDQNVFHAHAAQLYLWEKNFRAAEAELLLCLEKSPETGREDLLDLIVRVRADADALDARRKSAISPEARSTPTP